MLNFYPGPSRIYPQVAQFAQDAFGSGILERNHRSPQFKSLLAQCTQALKAYFGVPQDYAVYYLSSATEAWEICAQSLLTAPHFVHNGAFGEKWCAYTRRLLCQTTEKRYAPEEWPVFEGEGDLCFVANETSNGTHVPHFPDPRKGLICVDAVSSFGGVEYDVARADVWITSVQKCFGLPSGMGIMLASPKALERAREKGDRAFYNSLLFLEDNFSKFETPYTPSILGVYLLQRLLETLPPLEVVSQHLAARARALYRYFEGGDLLQPLVRDTALQSPTVLALTCPRAREVLLFLEENGAIVGKGYGHWKGSTIRIANFPAIPDADYVNLSKILATFAADSPKKYGIPFSF